MQKPKIIGDNMNSKFKMILSILLASIIFIFALINILFSNTFGIIFKSLIGIFGISYYILLSIYFVKSYESIPIKRISNCFKYVFISMTIIYLILLLKSNLKWILFGFTILINILSIIFQATNIFNNINKIFDVIRLFIILILSYILADNLLFYIFISFGSLLFYLIDDLVYKNKFIVTYFLYFVIYILFGIFLLYN